MATYLRCAAVSCLLLLVPSLPAQTAAQKALANEPEIKGILRNADETREQQALPYNDIRKQSMAANLFQNITDIKVMDIALKHLQHRLETKVYDCIHQNAACPWLPAQEELSELIHQQLDWQELNHSLGGDRLTNVFLNTTNRWNDRTIAETEAAGVISAHCKALDASHQSSSLQCEQSTEGGYLKLASAHESAWSACFKSHDWIKSPAERAPYEACLDQTDPLVVLCTADRKRSPARSDGTDRCGTEVTVDDLYFLRNYHDRWDPAKNTASVKTVTGSPVHVTLLEPLLAPETPLPRPGVADTGGKTTVRGRIENVIQGEAPNLAPGRIDLIPVGTEVKIEVSMGPAHGHRTSAILMLHTSGVTLAGPGAHQLYSQFLQREIQGWPQAGSVLIPAGTPLTFETKCGCLYPMSQADFLAKAKAVPGTTQPMPIAPHPGGRGKGAGSSVAATGTGTPASPSPATTNASNDDYSSRPILVGSRIQTVLLEPVDVAGIQSGKRFHAQLNVDMELPHHLNRTDELQLPRGTDVYLKAIDKNSGAPYGGHTAELSIDYVLINGKQIPLVTPPWTHTFSDAAQRSPAFRRAPAESVLWPTGDTKWFQVIEQAEVPRDALQGGTQLQTLTSNAVALNEADKNALRIYAGSQLPLVLTDAIDLNSVRSGKLFAARLSGDIVVQPSSRHPDMLMLPAGTVVYLKAIAKDSGSPTHTPVEISVDHVVFKGANILVETAPVTKMTGSGQTVSPLQVASRAFSITGLGGGRIPHGSSAATESNPLVLAAQSRLALTVDKDAIVPGAR